MKHLVFLIFISFISCHKNENNPSTGATTQITTKSDTINKVAVLKLNYLTYSFLGGYELEFPDTNSFTLHTNIYPAGDFGSIDISYQEFDELIFDGTIIWSGTGQQTFPQTITPAADYFSIPIDYPMPDTSLFIKVLDDPYFFNVGFHSQLWDSINNLSILHEYRTNNPGSEINLLKYTPSVGVGNPTEWYWYVILKN